MSHLQLYYVSGFWDADSYWNRKKMPICKIGISENPQQRLKGLDSKTAKGFRSDHSDLKIIFESSRFPESVARGIEAIIKYAFRRQNISGECFRERPKPDKQVSQLPILCRLASLCWFADTGRYRPFSIDEICDPLSGRPWASERDCEIVNRILSGCGFIPKDDYEAEFAEKFLAEVAENSKWRS